MRKGTEKFLGVEIGGPRVFLTEAELSTLMKASRIAGRMREYGLYQDADLILAEIEHGCREVADGEVKLDIDPEAIGR